MSTHTISYAGRENSRRVRINISGCWRGENEEDGTSTQSTTRRRANLEKNFPSFVTCQKKTIQ